MPRGRNAEDTVRTFYDRFGWKDHVDGGTGEDQLFRRFPSAYYEIYASSSEERIASLFEGRTGRLLVVGSGDLPQSHMSILQRFSTTTCMDISQRALDRASEKLGDRANYVLDSIVSTALDGGQFDAVFCAHVLYHIGAREQEAAVRQMLRLTKRGGRVVIIYSNPLSPLSLIGKAFRPLRRSARGSPLAAAPELYFHAHKLGWWMRFDGDCKLSIVPGEVCDSATAQLLRIEAAARGFYRVALWLETTFPTLSAKVWTFPIIVLDKR
jgi:SAM-dependent methyltransferase